MRIRTFTAPNAQAAMALVRTEMGPAAVIIAIDETANRRGVIIRAAADEAARAVEPAPQSIEERLEALLALSLRPAKAPLWRAA